MKILYKHLVKYIKSPPTIDELSERLFQLGHEHEIENDIIDLDLTPNRGDCFSLNGILRELRAFYDVSLPSEFFLKEIEDFNFSFENKSKLACPKITFMKIEIDKQISEYKDELKDYFVNLDNKKNNFFTDISNYISYETGQPTHCYDLNKINGKVCFEAIDYEKEFETLVDTKIKLVDKNYVFTINNEIINLAGIIGGKGTSCSNSSRSVLIECAYFNPEIIIGKSQKYDIKSEASHKFERGVDFESHEKTLRRFAYIVNQHSKIKRIQLVQYQFEEYQQKKIELNYSKINKILGTNEDSSKLIEYLEKLDIVVENDIASIPSHRNDIETLNDIAEEVARIIGYNNIIPTNISINNLNQIQSENPEQVIRSYLIENGFFEVINQPFTKTSEKDSIGIDNPLDSNKGFMRKNLKDSLIDNLIFNERRQKESIKLFEISDVYSLDTQIRKKRRLAIIGSGRIANNYELFQKKITRQYFENLLNKVIPNIEQILVDIPRDQLNTKLNSKIVYLEIDIEIIETRHLNLKEASKIEPTFFNVSKISEFPSSIRDISFSIKDYKKMEDLENSMLKFEDSLIKDVFIFDYYKNDDKNEIKIGFRFIFQDKEKTITDIDIDKIYNKIINEALNIQSVSIPGYSP